MDMIKADNIVYTYPQLDEAEGIEDKENKQTENTVQKSAPRALSDVSLSVRPGQFVCVLGGNGSGKSTFAKHLNALITPDEGTVWVDGMSTSDEGNIWEIRKKVGMVFQNPDNQIIGSIVDEDVAFGLENIGASTQEIRKGVKQALEAVNMSAFDKSSPNKLSGGQKQRVAVAGVLAMNPKCIVLDESTAMLDPKGRREVMDTVKRLNKERGITIISITHFMEEALEADHIFVMHKGRLVMEGKPEDIFSREEEIEEYMLDLPQICKIAKRLREGGLDIPRGIITEEELSDAIEAAKNK